MGGLICAGGHVGVLFWFGDARRDLIVRGSARVLLRSFAQV